MVLAMIVLILGEMLLQPGAYPPGISLLSGSLISNTNKEYNAHANAHSSNVSPSFYI